MATLYENYITGESSWATLHVARAQTFTPSISHNVTSVKILHKALQGTVNEITVFITATSGDVPPNYHPTTMPYIAKGTITPTGWANDTWYEILMNVQEGVVVASTMYGLVIVQISADADNNNLIWFDHQVATYAGGAAYYWDGAAWTTIQPGEVPDWLFEEWGDPAAPTVTTQAVTNIERISATGNGNITDVGASSVTEHGHCWSTSANPTTADSKTENGAGSAGAFTSAITGLTLGTLYHTRAYATNSYGTSYGADVEFTTLSFIGQVWII